MVAWIQSFINEMKKDSGKTPVIYTSTSWWDTCTGNSAAFKTDPLWLASWGVSVPSIPSAWTNLTFWQYSDSGAVSGIGGAVDLDSLGPTQASAVNTAIPAEQIQTLSSLEAQNLPSGYSATGLPTGLSISATGVITGKPTAIGQYSVTVTPPAGAAPASMSFPWDVHGAITVSNPAEPFVGGGRSRLGRRHRIRPGPDRRLRSLLQRDRPAEGRVHQQHVRPDHRLADQLGHVQGHRLPPPTPSADPGPRRSPGRSPRRSRARRSYGRTAWPRSCPSRAAPPARSGMKPGNG